MVMRIFLALWIVYLSYVHTMDDSEVVRRYMGCYENFTHVEPGKRTLENMTLSTCIDLCPIQTFVALKSSSECYCGDQFSISDNEDNCNFMSTKDNGISWRNSFSVFAVCHVGYYGANCSDVCRCVGSVPCRRTSGVCLFQCRISMSHEERCDLTTKLNDVDVALNLPFRMDNLNDVFKLEKSKCIYLEKDRFYFDFKKQVTIKRGSVVFENIKEGKIIIHIHSSLDNAEELNKIDTSVNGNLTTYHFGNNEAHFGKYLAFSLPDRSTYAESICKLEVYLQDCKNSNSCHYNENCLKLSYGNTHFKRCVCQKGFSRASLDEHCTVKLEDIDECEMKLDKCDKNSSFCVDQKSGYTCNCKDGFDKRNIHNKFTCADINECTTTKKDLHHHCDKATTTCQNIQGSYKCICREGFMPNNNDTYSCLDVDECSTSDDRNSSKCDVESTNCENTVGSFKCVCKIGFESVDESSSVCRDINECLLNRSQCDSTTTKCSNTFGSYKCSCRIGFKSLPNNLSACQDIDECKNISFNENTADCINLVGGYQLQCKEGFYNHSNEDDDDDDTYTCRPRSASIGLYIVIAVFVFLVTILVILIWRQVKMKHRRSTKISEVVSHQSHSLSQKFSEVTEMKNGTIKSTSKEFPEEIPSTKVPMEDLEQYIEEAYVIESEGFKIEFEEIPKIFDKCATYSRRENLKLKNRYRNIFPYDDNRVCLTKFDDDPSSDYINASFLKVPYVENSPLIVTQGPLKETVNDFWRMVAEQDVEVIVMMTQVEEGDVTKCYKYWPDEDSRIYGDFVVTKLSETMWLNYCKRTFALSGNLKNRGQALGEITQWQYLKWPDHGVPQDEVNVLEFRSKIRKSVTGSGKMLIHCSAGVGRTGCYIAIDSLLDEASKTGFVDVVTCLHNLRQQRPFLVQTLEQYQFIYKVLRSSKSWTDTCISLRNFHEEFLRRTEKTDSQSHNLLHYEFLKLRNQCPVQDEDISLNETLLRPNRRIFKAIKIHGYSNGSQFVVGNYPENWDIESFWELVDKDNCLVLLIDHNGDSHPPFIPSSSKPLLLNNFYIELESIESYKFGPILKVNLTNRCSVAEHTYENAASLTVSKGSKRRYTVMHASSPTAMFLTWRFFCEIKQFAEMLATEGQMPVVFVAGKLQCPLPAFYVACSILFEQMTEHDEVDVFKIILKLRKAGIGLEFTAHQYEEMYKLIETEVCHRLNIHRTSTLEQRFSTISRC